MESGSAEPRLCWICSPDADYESTTNVERARLVCGVVETMQ